MTHKGLELSFVNLEHNLNRFRRGILFSISPADQDYVPSIEELRRIFIEDFLGQAEVRPFLEDMAARKAQGYLRPFTLDEEQSIGVTFPHEPGIRAAFCSYDRYLGEPFSGVVVPNLVRAVTTNGTGCLKLGSNYLLSVKAVQYAKQVLASANAALFLDDRPDKDIFDRMVTEWDSSCCLFALSDGSIVKIPEGPLILPSVTIQGVCSLAKERGISVQERQVRYGELVQWAKSGELVAVCSIGTAGILNRCEALHLVDNDSNIIVTHRSQKEHPLFTALSEIRADYWKLFTGEKEVPVELRPERHLLG